METPWTPSPHGQPETRTELGKTRWEKEMGAKKARFGVDPSITGRIPRVTIAASCVLVVLLVLTAPAAATKPVVSDHAPYTGSHVIWRHSPVIGWSCASQWAWLTGHRGAGPISGDVFVGSSACATGPTPNSSWPNYPTLTTTEGLLGPAFTSVSGGIHQVVYDWQVSWNATGSASRGAFAAIGIELVGGLFDNSTGRWVGPGALGNSTSVLVFFQRGSFSAGGTDQLFQLQFNVTLTSGDQYQFYTVMHTSDTVYASTWCAPRCHVGTGSADLNVNSGGDGAKILSMSVV